MTKKPKNKFFLYKTTGNHCRPTERHCIRYNGTIVAIIPDYMDLKLVKAMISRLNLKTARFKLKW